MAETKPRRPVITVIIPAKNAEKTLPKAIESVKKQTFKRTELLIIDDGSSDATGEIAEKTEGAKVIHTEGVGISEARNIGVKTAEGLYIFFLDADDWIEPDTLDDLYDLAWDLNADMAMTGTVRETEDGVVIDETDAPKVKTAGRERYLSWYGKENGAEYVRVWGKLFDRRLLENVTFPKGRRNEDVFVFVDLYERLNTAAFSSRHGYHYVQTENSIMRGKPDEHTFDCVDAAAHVFDRFQETDRTALLPAAEGKIYAAMKRLPARGDLALEPYFCRAEETLEKRIQTLKALHLYSLRSHFRDWIFLHHFRKDKT